MIKHDDKRNASQWHYNTNDMEEWRLNKTTKETLVNGIKTLMTWKNGD